MTFYQSHLKVMKGGERLIYHKFDTDTDISTVAKTLTDLLERIEIYKKRTEE